MHTHVQKWGNSLALRIPVQLSRQLGIHSGSTVDISIEDDHLVVKPGKVKLDYLLAQITEENCYHEAFKDDSPIGNEVW